MYTWITQGNFCASRFLISMSLAESSVWWISLREMAATTTATAGSQITVTKRCISATQKILRSSIANFGNEIKGKSCTKLKCIAHISSTWSFYQKLNSTSLKYQRIVTKAMSTTSDKAPLPGLPIDLRGRTSICFSLSSVSFSFGKSKT